jgi:hypothetical protein
LLLQLLLSLHLQLQLQLQLQLSLPVFRRHPERSEGPPHYGPAHAGPVTPPLTAAR